jgi:uncharacterized protein (DUF1697 family)
MQRIVALLRGINVGGHTVKMPELRRLFETCGFQDVETVIASGNVVFTTDRAADGELESAIEQQFKESFGYAASTFVRSLPEMTAVAKRQPFDLAAEVPGAVVYTLFLRNRPSAAVRRALSEITTTNDEARAGSREAYWLRRVRCPESDVFGVKLGKILGNETTSRNFNTVVRLVDKMRS